MLREKLTFGWGELVGLVSPVCWRERGFSSLLTAASARRWNRGDEVPAASR